MAKPLWAPWRLEYIEQADEYEGCVFCREAADEIPESESLVVVRGETAFAILNKFPYSSGHLMVAPLRHEGALEGLTDAEALEAGITDHVHLHVVPRWSGDTNFMPVLADVKVLPEHLFATRERLREAWPSR